MFTGIIENTGRIARWRPSRSGGKLFVAPREKFTGIKIGESVAINGCCLTVVSYRKGILEFDVSDETMRKTALGCYEKGDAVNLERAMKATERFGGHFVLGHVDGIGKVRDIRVHEGSVEYVISYPKGFSNLLIEKGSVAVDGISLTVCDLKDGRFSAYVIPHTLKETHLGGLKKGASVNLEFDVLGKYAARNK